MGQFATLARAELDEVTVTISDPYGFPGGVWNDTEYAFMKIEVHNTATVTLRDVIADAHVAGRAAIAPIKIFGWEILDGDFYWDEIEAGETKSYIIRLRGGSGAGNVHTWVGLSAEIVPFASDWHIAHADSTVHPI